MSRSDPDTLVVIAPLGTPAKRPRLEKTIRLAAQRGWKVEFWGWKRTGEDDLGLGLDGVVDGRALLRGGGHMARSTRLLYPVWALLVFWNMLTRRPRRVFALGLETAIGAWAATRLRSGRYVFDDADRLVMLLNAPKPIDRALRFFERRVSGASAAHVVPGLERYEYRTPAMQLVPNTPDKGLLDQARDFKVARPDAALVVYINGWLHEGRGLGWVRAVAESLPADPLIHFILAGDLADEDAEALAALPCATSLGRTSQVEALAWYRAADLVATFYDPRLQINRFAIANKWGDALFTGTAILLNREVVPGAPYLDSGAAFGLDYGDVDGLRKLLLELAGNPGRIADARRAAVEMRARTGYYDDAMAAVLAVFGTAPAEAELPGSDPPGGGRTLRGRP